MKRVFLDANVLFTAAHNPRGKAALVFESSAARRWLLLTSSYAIAEARHNLGLKFPETLNTLDALLRYVNIVNPIHGTACPIALAEKDQPILLAAIAGKATHLLPGDIKDFGRYMNQPAKTCGILVQTVADFLE